MPQNRIDGWGLVSGLLDACFAARILAAGLLLQGQRWLHSGAIRAGPGSWCKMKTYDILLGNSEEILNDFIEALFREVYAGKAVVECTRAARTGDLVRQASDSEFDLVVLVPHNLLPEVSAPTPMGFVAEAIRSIHSIKYNNPVPVVAIVAPDERSKYEPLLLEAGADCVLELPFDGDQLTSAVVRLLQFPDHLEYLQCKRWFFAGVLMRGLRRLAQA